MTERPSRAAGPHAEICRLAAIGRPERDGSELVAQLLDELRDLVVARPPWLPGLIWFNSMRIVRATSSAHGQPPPTPALVGAAIDGDELAGDPRVARALAAYANTLATVGELARDRAAALDVATVAQLHATATDGEDGARPGRWRTGRVGVVDAVSGGLQYEPPPAEQVGALVDELVAAAPLAGAPDALVAAAVTMFNLMRIHPFDDGNGRVGRAVHTLLRSRASGLPPPLVSIEEQLGQDLATYQGVMYGASGRRWSSHADPRLWVHFCLMAQVVQGETNLRRFAEAERLWQELAVALPASSEGERARLFDAALGRRLPFERVAPPGSLGALLESGWLVRGHGVGEPWVEAAPRLATLGQSVRGATAAPVSVSIRLRSPAGIADR